MGSIWHEAPQCAECGVGTFTIKKAGAKSVLAGAVNITQHGTDSRWQHETPYKEEVELVVPTFMAKRNSPAVRGFGGIVLSSRDERRRDGMCGRTG